MIRINDEYYIDADSRCYTLEKNRETLGYYTTLEGVLKGFLKTELRKYIKESKNGSMQDLLRKLDELDKFIREKLKDF